MNRPSPFPRLLYSALLASAALLLGPAARAQTPAPVAAPTPSAPAPSAPAGQAPIRVLIDQANYWRLQNRGDLALTAVQRALLIDPRNADALALSAQVNADAGNRDAAMEALNRLRAAQPGDPRIATVEAALRIGRLDPAVLAEARALSRQNRPAEAVARYRELFRGGAPPDTLAVEYYQVLAASQGGWDSARAGLAQYVARTPQDTRGQLAYAQLLTYQQDTRADGISRLRILATNPATAESARAAWRQALDWLPVNADSIPSYRAYLDKYPDDTITQRMSQAEHPVLTPADQAGIARQRGYDALKANRLADAEAAFRADLDANPNDADALGGMGLVRQRQGRIPEARELLERAIAAAPDKAQQWQPALAGLNVSQEYASARALAAQRQYAAAAAQLRGIIARGGDTTGAVGMLADVQARMGDLPGAERSYRTVLARQPGNAQAVSGLADVLGRQGRDSEAEALLANMPGSAATAGRLKAQRLRQQAAQAPDPQTAITLLRAASGAAPGDPWVRLDLARALNKAGRAGEARAEIAALTAGTSPSVEALQAAALFAMENNEPATAAGLVQRIPAGRRDAAMNSLLARAQFQQEVRLASADPASRRRLLAMAASPDPDGSRVAAIVRALAAMGDTAGAREAVATALAADRNPTAAARLAYAGALLEAGMEDSATRMAQSLDGANLSADQRQALARLRTGVAIRRSDQLNQQGQTADAYDQLAPALSQNPDDPGANMALARLYQTAGDPRQALAIATQLLSRDPDDLDVRRGAVGAALQLGDLRTAQTLVSEGLAASPDDPRAWMMSADLARARYDNRGAVNDLRKAQALRRQQIGDDGATPGLARAAAPEDFRPAYRNPFRSAESAPARVASNGGGLSLPGAAPQLASTDPMLAQIERDLAAERAQNAVIFQVSTGLRTRSGSGGLDQLTDITVPMEASFSPGGHGRMTVTATPTLLSAGSLDASNQKMFGTATTGGVLPDSQHAEGLGLAVAYAYGPFKADIGTTPLGFREQSIVGGLEVAPEIAPNTRLRITGERRAVTDSILSYAGTRDPVSGQSWGGVVRNRGYAQIEGSAGLMNFYAGGGYSVLTGHHVRENQEFELGAGGTYPVYRTATDELRVGLNLVYFGYSRNLRYFTVGNGGYFSPQSYFAALVPVEYTSKGENLVWSLGGAVGIQSYTEKASAICPTPDSACTSTGTFPGKSQSGLGGNAHGKIEYRINTNIWLGADLSYQKAGSWDEGRALVYARYRLQDTE